MGDKQKKDIKLEIKELSKIFESKDHDKVVALERISFKVFEGDFVTILGPSGCGKSTLLRCIAGFEKTSGGEVLVRGQKVDEPGPDRTMVFQTFDQLFPWKTVLQNIVMPLTVNKISKNEAEQKALSQLELVGLKHAAHQYPHHLSGGMKQRVAIARALALDPDILLMDEPFASLDAQQREILQRELSLVWEKTHKTILFVTHSISEALVLGTKILILSANPGKVKALVDNELPVPRDPNTSDFAQLRGYVYKNLEHVKS